MAAILPRARITTVRIHLDDIMGKSIGVVEKGASERD
jgi:hypothetical protein